jgi:hypothetical protein
MVSAVAIAAARRREQEAVERQEAALGIRLEQPQNPPGNIIAGNIIAVAVAAIDDQDIFDSLSSSFESGMDFEERGFGQRRVGREGRGQSLCSFGCSCGSWWEENDEAATSSADRRAPPLFLFLLRLLG